MFENIKQLRPYFFSLREIDVNVSLDLKLPITWTYEKIITQYSSIKFKVQDKNEKHNLVSLISDATQEGYDVVFACSIEILNFNREEEEKRKLFQQKNEELKRIYEQKMNELKKMFEKESLDKLKEINVIDTDGSEDNTRIGLAGK
jgi:hypothetical protein